MKKETLIRLVVGLGDVCLAIALFMVGICFDWFVMLFPERDCPCDHFGRIYIGDMAFGHVCLHKALF